MIVVCKIEQCPYNVKKMFCGKRVLNIVQNGGCSQLYTKRGEIKQNIGKMDQEKE